MKGGWRAGVLGLAAALAPLLAGCGRGGAESGTVTLRFSWWGNDKRTQVTLQAIEAFQKKNPNIRIKAENGDWGSYWDKLATQGAGNDAPDVIQMNESYIAEYGKRGALLDLEKAGVKTDRFAPGAADAGRLKNGLFGINAGINAPAYMANPKIFEAAGVPLPDDRTWNWDRMADTARRIAKACPKGTYGMENPVGVEPVFKLWLRQAGKDQYGELGMAWEPADGAPFFEWAKKLASDGATPSASEVSEETAKPIDQTLAATGKLAMWSQWSNQASAVEKVAGTKILLLRPPSATGRCADNKTWYKASMLWSASAKTRHPKEVAAFIDFLANSQDAGRILGTERGVPANLDVRKAVEPSMSETDKRVAAYLDAIASDLGPVPIVTPVGGGKFESILQRHGQDVLFGRKSPAAAAKALHEEMKGLLK
ncbi:MAG: extracellular solute-binding protein [Planctomycetota bacterium]